MRHTLTTTLHAYYFNTANADEKAAYRALKQRLTDQGLTCFETWGQGSHYLPESDKATLTLETDHLFNNQWNTSPCKKSDKGYRVFDWAQDYMVQGNKQIKKGHYLDQTPAMREIRRNTVSCGYCGKQEAAQKGSVFCPYCLDSEYLTLDLLHLTRMQSVESTADRAPLTQAEKDYLIPLYKHAQLHGSTARGTARLTKQRRDIEATFEKDTRNAKTERDGFIWLLDHGVQIDNVIFYNHTQRFGFGWRSPVSEAVKSDLLDILTEFPFDYDIKAEKGA